MPLFREPDSNAPISYDTLLNLVKTLASYCGDEPTSFGAHSLRIGGATALFAAGATQTIIRTMGRWSSDIYRLYVRACYEHECRAWTAKGGSTTVSDLAGEYSEVDGF